MGLASWFLGSKHIDDLIAVIEDYRKLQAETLEKWREAHDGWRKALSERDEARREIDRLHRATDPTRFGPAEVAGYKPDDPCRDEIDVDVSRFTTVASGVVSTMANVGQRFSTSSSVREGQGGYLFGPPKDKKRRDNGKISDAMHIAIYGYPPV